MEIKKSTIHKITFGWDRYHQHGEMIEWCKENCGCGTWVYDSPQTWVGLETVNWTVHNWLSCITFSFRDSKHLSMFILRWS